MLLSRPCKLRWCTRNVTVRAVPVKVVHTEHITVKFVPVKVVHTKYAIFKAVPRSRQLFAGLSL
jgi:hypothetical protein